VVTIGPEGRIPWRFRFEGFRSEPVRIGIAEGDLIEVVIAEDPTARHADSQGRLQLPQGVLRAIGGRPGDRMAVVRLPGDERLALVGAERLGIRRRTS